MKVLFCSPFSDVSDVVMSGINTWGGNFMEYYSHYAFKEVELIPVSFDRHVDVSEGQSIVSRILSGYKEYNRVVKEAIYRMDVAKISVIHSCTCADLVLFRDLLLLKVAKRREKLNSCSIPFRTYSRACKDKKPGMEAFIKGIAYV